LIQKWNRKLYDIIAGRKTLTGSHQDMQLVPIRSVTRNAVQDRVLVSIIENQESRWAAAKKIPDSLTLKIKVLFLLFGKRDS
jgi:DNA-binding cell septation regulator SpoVG